jgi:hypothetical protein
VNPVRTPCALVLAAACGLLEGHPAQEPGPQGSPDAARSECVAIGLASLNRGTAVGRFAAMSARCRRRLGSDAIDEGLWPHAFHAEKCPIGSITRRGCCRRRCAAVVRHDLTQTRQSDLGDPNNLCVRGQAAVVLLGIVDRWQHQIEKRVCSVGRTTQTREQGPDWTARANPR